MRKQIGPLKDTNLWRWDEKKAVIARWENNFYVWRLWIIFSSYVAHGLLWVGDRGHMLLKPLNSLRVLAHAFDATQNLDLAVAWIVILISSPCCPREEILRMQNSGYAMQNCAQLCTSLHIIAHKAKGVKILKIKQFTIKNQVAAIILVHFVCESQLGLPQTRWKRRKKIPISKWQPQKKIWKLE